MSIAVGDEGIQDQVAAEHIKCIQLGWTSEPQGRSDVSQRAANIDQVMARPSDVWTIWVNAGLTLDVSEVARGASRLKYDWTFPEIVSVRNNR
ncbi:hypothetical protein SAMN05192575_101272 [Nocardioides alpinus]|uniref:Uncharacterized protein n=1 Tax=Nocardioides alpinus TaxID=748909 RepID=A0A1I0VL72_9ACTN|nr:hypothetical protein [Nocardioides alpinus]PKH37314.1 hypothetical protein CXG46_17775 [Nocardioides alpinus]SFA76650.1 hypothetical protein SAMN05192575_101272 [Nocardioides alpinus]